MASKAGAKKKNHQGTGAVPLGQFPGFPSWAGTATRIKPPTINNISHLSRGKASLRIQFLSDCVTV